MRIISGRLRGKKLSAPSSQTTRPTSDRARETLFNVLEHNPVFAPFAWQNRRILDVFAGTGALGLEALSRGALCATFIEHNPEVCQILQQNITACAAGSHTKVLGCDVKNLPQAKESYDIVFLDPPYGKGLVEPTLQDLIGKKWLMPGALVLVETGTNEDLYEIKGMTLLLERQVGAAKICFLKFMP